MSRPAFRLATVADAYEIAVMSRYLVEVGLRGWSWHPERVAKAVRSRDTSVVVAEVERNFVGFAIMEFGDVKAHLSLLAVKPSHQRCNIGRQLLEWLEEAALVLERAVLGACRDDRAPRLARGPHSFGA